MTPEASVLSAILLCIAGTAASLLVSRNKTAAGSLAFLITLASAVLICSAVAMVLTQGPSPHPVEVWSLPKFGFALRIHVDGLSAIFLLLAAFIAVPASFYSIAYLHSYSGYGAARYYPHFLLFLAAMYGLLSTTDMMWFFFLFWQLMTLSGYALIRYENRKPQNIRAANKYLVMMEIACIATMIGAELLAVASASAEHAALKYDFDSLSANIPILLSENYGATMVAFALFLIGFGIKMGMWPFGQIWLPDAHPAAPSPVSAMLSGVMIKTGVYGLMRYFLWLVPSSAWASYPLVVWGMIVSVLGTITLFSGTMQALKQEQSKRLLAFHSIGQIGYILLGLGACMALIPTGDQRLAGLAAIGMFGALFHVMNHGVFKGLLFLNAGSLLYATDTQDLNKLGGLMKFMPVTAITVLVASFSISGVPLFNGFVSKWSIYVAAVQGSGAALYLPVCAIIAILTSALTLASFIKFFGVSFLSRPSTLVMKKAARRGGLEVPWIMQLPQVLLAVVCVALGIVPSVAFRFMHQVFAARGQGFDAVLADAMSISSGPLSGVQELRGAAVFVPIALAFLLGALFLFVRILSKLGGAQRRMAAPWLCGYVREADCHRYNAHNFYGEIKRYFRWLGGETPPSSKGENILKEPKS